jgi:hypothetical protein
MNLQVYDPFFPSTGHMAIEILVHARIGAVGALSGFYQRIMGKVL